MKATKSKGQGIVEYAGALVLAGVVVATVLAAGPNTMGTMFTNVLGKLNAYFTGVTITAASSTPST